ncbi:sensor histidine kinase [Streptomonospora salina]|uniref:histidine kinase n=1 Tax=Streptomonospora salina TaxID=104205 RepID=A0A841E908_9ACTN|nr:sensor histidine kinase [Streptomonospora salina]MBB6000477.1 signal transduction histidine kinase [Streptomonospora salina]
MSDGGTPRDLSRWIEFSGSGPPRVLNVFFWGTAMLVLAVHVNAILGEGTTIAPDWVLADGLLASGLLSMVPICVLWPLLAWHRSASAPRKAASCVFLFSALLPLPIGGIAAVILVSLSIGNAAAVFGMAGGIGYAASATLFALAVSLANPALSLVNALASSSVMLFLCLAMLVVFGALMQAWRRAEETRRLLAELERAHGELRRYAERTRELTVAEERARMAREMHDSIGHYLTIVNMGLANAQRFRSARPDDAWQEVSDAQALTQEALADARRWVRALKPLQLDGRAGIEAMRALAQSFSGAGAAVRFNSLGRWPDTDEATELICYRTLQEGITNALRHSDADRIEAVVDCTGEEVDLSVIDNGGGAAGAAEGFGLSGLRERVEEAGGRLLARSPAEGGFELVASVPVENRGAEREPA